VKAYAVALFNVSGARITASWATPTTGTYSLHISASDSAGLSATATLPITITAR
jgi:hypothetical protein